MSTTAATCTSSTGHGIVHTGGDVGDNALESFGGTYFSVSVSLGVPALRVGVEDSMLVGRNVDVDVDVIVL